MRVFTLLLLLLLACLQYTFWAGKNGMSDYQRVKADVAQETLANAQLRDRNQQMYAEIDDLKAGGEAIEEKARNELGLVKPDETFYRIVSER